MNFFRSTLLLLTVLFSLASAQAWYRLYGFQSASNSVNALRCDNDGNLWLAGSNYDSLGIFDTVLRSNGSNDCFFLQTDDSGYVKNVHSFGGVHKDAINDLIVKSNQHLLVTGTFQNSMRIGDSLLSAPVSESFFMAEFSADTTPVWTTVNSAYSGMALASCESGEIAVAGQMFDTAVIVPGDTLFGRGEQDVFLAYYNSDGSPEWALSAGGTTQDQISAVQFAGNDHIYLALVFKDTLHFGDTLFVPPFEGEQGLIAKFDTAGTPLWFRPVLSDGSVLLRSMTTDGDGNVYIAGKFSGNLTLDTLVVSSSNEFSMFLAKLLPNGNLSWIQLAELADANNVVLGDDDNLFLCGNFKRNTTFGDSVYTSHDIEDIFVCSYSRDGEFRWASTAGGCRASYGRKLVVHGDNCYVSGSTDADLVSKSCTMHFDWLEISYSQLDRGRAFVSFLNHTLPPGSGVKQPPAARKTFFRPAQQPDRYYDLLGREVTGAMLQQMLHHTRQSAAGRTAAINGVIIRQRNDRTTCSVMVR